MPALPLQLQVGRLLPEVDLSDAAGAAVPLRRLADQAPVLLFFHKADCPATAVAGPVLVRFARLAGLDLVAVTQDGADEAAALQRACGWEGTVRLLRDPEPWPASNAIGARVTPTWVLAGPGGKIADAAEGWSREDVNRLAATAAGLLGLAPPTISAEGGAEPAWRPG